MKFFPLKHGFFPLKTLLAYLGVSILLLSMPASCSGPVRRIVLVPFSLAQRGLLLVLRGAERVGDNSAVVPQGGADVIALHEEIADLKVRLAEESYERRMAEARLAQVAKLPATLHKRTLSATVIGYDPSPLSRRALLNQGSEAGVVPDAVILWNGMVVGRVESVEPRSCWAILIGDLKCRVAVRCARSRARGILEGIGGGACAVKYMNVSDDVRVGDLFVTSGLDNIFPAGHLVGQCTKVSAESHGFFKAVEIKPLFDLVRMDEVAILLPEQAEATN